MMGWSLVTAVIRAILGWGSDRRAKRTAAEQKQRAEAKSQKLKSVKRAKTKRRKVREAGEEGARTSSKTAAEFNQRGKQNKQARRKRRGGGGAILLLTCLLGIGCETLHVYYEGEMSVVEIPDRPVIAETPPLTERERQIIEWAERLEAMLDELNRQAIEHNRTHGYE